MFNLKTIPLVIGLGIILMIPWHIKPDHQQAPRNPIPIDTLYFKSTIQPILQKNCSPCHFPGGKMYAKMPFDKGETIVTHEAGALRRLSDTAERGRIEQFIKASKHH